MSTEVKPNDWNEEDNRWEPTPSGGGCGVPTPTADDNGKVLTAGADGTASWQTASGGISFATEGTIDFGTGTVTFTEDSSNWNGNPPSPYALISGYIYEYRGSTADGGGVYTYFWNRNSIRVTANDPDAYLELDSFECSQTGTTGTATLVSASFTGELG